jgi:hypothetical protein
MNLEEILKLGFVPIADFGTNCIVYGKDSERIMYDHSRKVVVVKYVQKCLESFNEN